MVQLRDDMTETLIFLISAKRMFLFLNNTHKKHILVHITQTINATFCTKLEDDGLRDKS